MGRRNIIVIGASAGGVEPLKKLISLLPRGFDAAIFIVWHISPSLTGVLPQILSRAGDLPAGNARDNEPIERGRIYVAPPDHHLVLEEGVVRISRGPKENGFRPAVDPLFRSAAYVYGPQVVGIVLSGALDDGTAGLMAIKKFGGIAIVQDPDEAEVRSMPERAMEVVSVDHCVRIEPMAALLLKLSEQEVPEAPVVSEEDRTRTEFEIDIAMQRDKKYDVLRHGSLAPLTCPECHGALVSIIEGTHTRFRCHTGHAFSAESLLDAINSSTEQQIWTAIRSLNESILLLNHMGDHFAESNQPKVAALYFREAQAAEKKAITLREAVFSNESLIPTPSQVESKAVKEDT
jgi:two-component system chemotaxis response regulator CheB